MRPERSWPSPQDPPASPSLEPGIPGVRSVSCRAPRLAKATHWTRSRQGAEIDLSPSLSLRLHRSQQSTWSGSLWNLPQMFRRHWEPAMIVGPGHPGSFSDDGWTESGELALSYQNKITSVWGDLQEHHYLAVT